MIKTGNAKTKMSNLFDYLNAINNKTSVEFDEKSYPAFMVNRGLSYFQDTVLMANEMNIKNHIDSLNQYDFYRIIVRKKKRFSKWHKATKDSNIDTIKEYFGYSNDKARQVRDLFSDKDIQEMQLTLQKGGKR